MVSNWPRVVQIAWVLTDDAGRELHAHSSLIRPNGFEIPLSATRIHGISTAQATQFGAEIEKILDALTTTSAHAKFIVAHNVEYDVPVVDAEYFRLGKKASLLSAKQSFCTMKSTTNFCQIPGPRGYKWPSLSELHQKLFGKDFDSAHDAVADVRACARCFFELRQRKVISAFGELEDLDEEDQDLFDQIYDLATVCDWFDTSRFVDPVYEQFSKRGSITDAQRSALERIRDMLEEKAGY